MRSMLALLAAMLAIGCLGSAEEDAAREPAGAADGARARGGSGSSTSTTATKGESPTDTTPRVRYVGRVDKSDPAGPRLAWPSTRVIVRFKGPALEVSLSERSIDSGPSEYDVTVDGKLSAERLVPRDGTGAYELASGLASNEAHVVELFRRTEPMVGVTQVLGFTYPGGGELLAPPAWLDRRVEFLGDSESTGYGIECAGTNGGFSGATEDARQTFPETAAAAVGAETHNVSYSGKGIMRNMYDDGVFFAELYPQAIPQFEGKTVSWSFEAWAPDVVWIGLGANDYDPGGVDLPPPDPAAFAAKYRALVDLVRKKNPTAHIVCAVQGMVNDDYPAGWDAYTNLKNTLGAIVDARHEAGDAKVHLHELPRAREADLTGCDYHPNAAWHDRASASVAAKIRAITGWK